MTLPQPLSHSAALPEWLEEPLSHSGSLPEWLEQPLSRSARVAGAATQPLCQSGWSSHSATQPLWQSGWGENFRRCAFNPKLDDGWPESEKDVFQAALRMVVVKDSWWIVGELYMSYGRIWCEKVRLIKKRILGKGHQMTRALQRQRERGRREREREWKGGVERKHGEI